jgi:hypothetical protein
MYTWSNKRSPHVVVGTTLAGWEDSFIDTLLKVIRFFEVLPEENQASAGAAEGLVSCVI